MSAQPRRQQPGIACEECRRKRIRCDRGTPECMACITSGTTCVVRESCPPRGPKKGYLKTLQKKIEDLQTQLDKQQDVSTTTETPQEALSSNNEDEGSSIDNNEAHNTAATTPLGGENMQQWPVTTGFQFPIIPLLGPWECMETPLSNPPFSVLDHYQETTQITLGAELNITPMMHNDLDQLYFDRAYAFAPILQARRYRSWSKQPAKSKPRACLQHAMWTLASSLSSQFQVAGRQLYCETRRLLHAFESDEGCHPFSIELVQAWTLLAIYELTCEDYHRGLISAGRAFRLVQMMRLYEVDLPQTVPAQHQRQLSLQGQPQEDWIDIETSRRTFWLAYIIDRFTSMVDGMHLFFDEKMIRTRLPAPEANFASGRPTETSFLVDMTQVMDLQWPDSELSSFTETVIVATICGRVLDHQQKAPSSRTRDATFEFCRRHRSLNALLGQRIKVLRMYASMEYLDPVLTFAALAAHIGVLMLYDLVESKPLGTEAQATQLTEALHTEHQQQSLDAVSDMALLFTVLGQHFQTHPLTPIPLLLGARFAQSHPGLNDAYNKLMPCIITTLQALTSFNRLAQSFLQLLGVPYDNCVAASVSAAAAAMNMAGMESGEVMQL